MPTIEINHVLWAVAFAWHYSLFCGFISDDHAAVAQRKDIIPDEEKKDRGESFWVKRFNDGIVMFYITRFFWALGFKNIPFPWHLFSLAVHVLNVWLLYLFLGPIVGYDIAMYTGAFWGVIPMLNQNVVWISGRPYLFGVFFAFVAMIGWQDPLCFTAFYLLAVVTNISIFFVPVLIFMIHPDAWQAKLYLGVMTLGALPFLVWKFNKRFVGGLVIDRDNFSLKKRKINTLMRMVLYYVWATFVPVRMGWYHQQGFRYNERWEKFNYLTLAGFILTALFIFYFKLPGWWFLLGLIPVANIYATNSFLQDRYLYFCSIGISLMIAPFLAEYPALFFITMTFYITRSYMYSRHMKNDEALYRENCRNHPKSDYARNNLVFFLIQKKRFQEAQVEALHGLEINRTNKMLWYNLGITWAAMGHFNNDEGKFRFLRAIDCWKVALQLEPRWAKPANDMRSLINLLVERKVLTVTPEDGTDGFSITVPAIPGITTQEGGADGSNQAIQGT